MKVIKAFWEVEEPINRDKIYKTIEKAGRTCYKSEHNISDGSAERFIANIIKRGHESVLEHEKITVRIICDRGVSHELVRHRLASYSQESTRYCNYSNDKFGNQLTFIVPTELADIDLTITENLDKYVVWEDAMREAEEHYITFMNLGAAPELARSVLPNSIKTEIVVTMNIREWRHFLKMRCLKAAHPDIRSISLSILEDFSDKLPVLFSDIKKEMTK